LIVDSDDFREGVNALGKLLNVSPNHDLDLFTQVFFSLLKSN